ncbi:MAG TPA: hypothetical protein VEV41_03150 [Terriglobales bacterium]|nr:hypothetical protein [Terriglobales bacterium]
MPTAKRAVAFCCGILSLLFAIAMLAGPHSATAQIRLKPVDKTLTISPAKATLFAGETQIFVAKVVAEVDGIVTWSVDEEDGGTITSWGVYTAPKVQGVYHVTATSTLNPQKKASATVTVFAYYDPPAALVRP